ncbi:molybdate ABC transporter substrate-binding protein [Sediminicurvatus halobius]|uniref:Molybdate ABC transporter substrate-binding protein n=1 Tax=Sediminicurvatus halobius TaxID=2182432 RepID=A0A2U2MVV6_9GAMM|nr:molybdate ABC transporter substrate-binding protein [Spiribacter halobius]PWG60990.1 molybdate ABC transporter substrate-binding protein [Spiribacter halobius]UEX77613.1 molybdate ABC transporter substrate-binding protein [Spiribacter halobius]
MSLQRAIGRRLIAALLLLLPALAQAQGETVRVAVATNFLQPLEAIAEALAAQGGPRVTPVPGATGRHYAQIVNGAPFDVFLAADRERPRRLEAEGLAVAGSRFTYARGRLVLWAAPGVALPSGGLRALDPADVRRFAIANPRLAPYGRAAKEVLRHVGLWDPLQSRLVQGENVGQTLQYVVTGNASHGLVAKAYARAPNAPAGRWQLVPADWHGPVAQDAVLLRDAPHPSAGRAFLEFLRGAEAARILEQFGYEPAEAGA